MKKIVYNNCYGGFSLSTKAILLARELSGNPMIWDCPVVNGEKWSHHCKVKRDDPILVQVVEQLGAEANGGCAELKIATVSGKWRIDEYDGSEIVQEPSDIEWND